MHSRPLGGGVVEPRYVREHAREYPLLFPMNTTTMAAALKKNFVWTEEEVELLLHATLTYKTNKLHQGVDWESCQSKYSDIRVLFIEQYPKPKDGEERVSSHPHNPEEMSKPQIASKLKAIRGKYRVAVDSSRRSGHGRVIWLYFDLCNEIWSGSPSTNSLPFGRETAGINGECESSSTNETCSATAGVEDRDHQDTETSQSEMSTDTALPSRRGLLQEDPECNSLLFKSRLGLQENEVNVQQLLEYEEQVCQCQTLRLQVEDLQKRLEEKDNKLTEADKDSEFDSLHFKSELQENDVHLQQFLEYEEQVCQCQTLRLKVEDLQKRLEEKDSKLTEADKVIRALRDEVQTLQQQLEQHRRKYRDDDTIGQRRQQGRRARGNYITALGCEIPPNVFLSCTSGDDPTDTPTSLQELTSPQELEDDSADFPASPAAAAAADDDDALTSPRQLKLPVLSVKLEDCSEMLGPDGVFKIQPIEDMSDESDDDDYGDYLCHQDDEDDDRDYDPKNDGFDFCCIKKETHSSPEEGAAEPEPPNQEEDEQPCHDNHTADTGEGSQVNSGNPVSAKSKHNSPQECDECGKILSGKGTLRSHKRTHTGEKPYSCSVCGKAFNNSSNLLRHKTSHTEERPHACAQCGKAYRTSSQLWTHKRTHTVEKTHPCSLCGKTFTALSDLWSHKKVAHSQRSLKCRVPHECDVCGKILSGKDGLIHHKRTHTGEKPYLCSVCGKAFRSLSNLGKHQNICKSPDHTEERSKLKYNGPHECDVCGKILSGKRSLMLHRRTHTGEKPYLCADCGNTFRTSSQYWRHRRAAHSQQMPEGSQVNSRNPGSSKSKYNSPHECDVCGKILSGKKSLILHIRTHTGKRPHPCSLCGKTFRTLGNLWSHKKVVHSQQRQSTAHTGEGSQVNSRNPVRSTSKYYRPSECDVCGKILASKKSLVLHQRTHTGEKPHPCSVCGKTFRTYSNLKSHKKSCKFAANAIQ